MLASAQQSRAFLGTLEVNDVPDVTIKVDDYQWRIHEKLISNKLASLKIEHELVSKNSDDVPNEVIRLQDEDPWIIARMIQFLYYGHHCLVIGDSSCSTADVFPHISLCCGNVSLKKMLEVGAKNPKHERLAKLDASRNAHEISARTFSVANKYDIPDLCAYAKLHLENLSYEAEDDFFKVIDIIGESVLYTQALLLETIVFKMYTTYTSNPADCPRFHAFLRKDLRITILVMEHIQRKAKDADQKYKDAQRRWNGLEEKYKDLERSKVELENKHANEVWSLEGKIDELEEELSFVRGDAKRPCIVDDETSNISSPHSETSMDQSAAVPFGELDAGSEDVSGDVKNTKSTAGDAEARQLFSPRVKSPSTIQDQVHISDQPPRKGLSAYTFFVYRNRIHVESKNSNIMFGQLGKRSAKQWAALPYESRRKYEKMADDDKLRYEKERANYDSKHKSHKDESSTAVQLRGSPASASPTTNGDQVAQPSLNAATQTVSAVAGAAGHGPRPKSRINFPPESDGSSKVDSASVVNVKPSVDTASGQPQINKFVYSKPPQPQISTSVKSRGPVLSVSEAESSTTKFSTATSQPQPQGRPEFGKPAVLGTHTSLGAPFSATKFDAITHESVSSGSFFSKSSSVSSDQSLPVQTSMFGGPARDSPSPFSSTISDTQSGPQSSFGTSSQSDTASIISVAEDAHPKSLFTATSQSGTAVQMPTAGGFQPKNYAAFGQGGFGIFGSSPPPSNGSKTSTTLLFGREASTSCFFKTELSQNVTPGFSFGKQADSVNSTTENGLFGPRNPLINFSTSGGNQASGFGFGGPKAVVVPPVTSGDGASKLSQGFKVT